jgi:two-component system, OmpR family, sensor kinase
MTLRTRLLVALASLLTLALLASGALVVGLTRASLVSQVDNELLDARLSDFTRGGPGRFGRGADPTGRRYALLLVERDGSVRQSVASGFGRAPDPLPALPAGGVDDLAVGRIVELPAVDGSLSYRALILPAQSNLYAVLGAPLRGVDEATGVLVRALLLVGVAVLAAMLVVGWLVVRRGLRPLERMTTTAERISAGDLSQRVGMSDGTEVGRLGHAFDSMLDQIQAAFESQHAALRAKEQSEGRLRQFVADASHELRTPLTALRGYAELYGAGGLDDQAELERAMTRIGTESMRMAALVEDLLLLARLDQGRPLRREQVSLSELVREAVDDARAVEPDRPLVADVSDDVTVTGDEDRLRQVIGNLFANFRVHTPPRTPVEVSLAARDATAALRVADHGPGVAGEHAERIFDRFYRGDAGRSRDRGGSGLGLAIASSVAAVHGGSIELSPTAGGGATFTLTLPRA